MTNDELVGWFAIALWIGVVILIAAIAIGSKIVW